MHQDVEIIIVKITVGEKKGIKGNNSSVFNKLRLSFSNQTKMHVSNKYWSLF